MDVMDYTKNQNIPGILLFIYFTFINYNISWLQTLRLSF